MTDELELLRKLRFGSVSEQELLDLHYRYRDNYRIQLNLVMHPRFPQKFSLSIITSLFAMDLLQVIKNRRANPFIRKKAELEFSQRYRKFPLGEKLCYMKVAPYSLLLRHIEEKDKQVLKVILENPNCTEDLLIRFINRKSPRHMLYEILMETDWHKRPGPAEAIAHDPKAPIRMVITALPYISRPTLRKLYENPETHDIVKKNIFLFLKERMESE